MADEDDWATFAQTATLVPFRGGRVRYLGWLRTEGVNSGWAGLWLWVEGPDRGVLEFDNLGQVPPAGLIGLVASWPVVHPFPGVPADA